ncbi:SDR family oxidoreductase [Sphingomonas sp. RG327]|jgi:NAD(P)-dependent dehydrogenase (short-subunit alcohol dehydrogenase family)|uniref:SDR family oxidoreductase n=1 Tax=Sphingomonas anseongensis TaxID=2908207 RepID=A0ABT0RGK8_9SPHN|nr:SDR family oxidoreductase [Sphingomonas anseongensis]MCL6679373.1 SDR family oxidoreductase [Sphingomonas anseongensis]
MPTVLITGANRGIGLEFARQYSIDGWDVVATVRDGSGELDKLGVRVEHLDMRDLDAVTHFGEHLDSLDLLIANAGTYGPKSVMSEHDGEGWLETFAVNTVAPFLLAQSVLERVARADGKLVAISTKMGSIEDNTSGGYIAYRSSKSALNSAWRSLAIDNRGRVTCAVLHPGWVQTRMGGSSAPLKPEDSVAGMRKVIEGLGPEQSGRFFGYDGSEIPW